MSGPNSLAHMRELQLAEAATGIADIFDDFILTAQDCRFSDCSHGVEPGCAVQAAIASGALTSIRFDRWRKLAEEQIVHAARQAKRRPR